MQALANTFERSLVTMHKMPRVWLMYLQVTPQHYNRTAAQ
jgi:pre-mRNA-splicing factor SYF1